MHSLVCTGFSNVGLHLLAETSITNMMTQPKRGSLPEQIFEHLNSRFFFGESYQKKYRDSVRVSAATLKYVYNILNGRSQCQQNKVDDQKDKDVALSFKKLLGMIHTKLGQVQNIKDEINVGLSLHYKASLYLHTQTHITSLLDQA